MSKTRRISRQSDIPELPESDCAIGCPHPRHVYSLLGHQSHETRLADALSSQRMHHAWLLTGESGIGKATLAYRLIRKVLGGRAQTHGRLDVPLSDPVAKRIGALGHGDFLLLRRPYDHKTKKLRSEIPVSETRRLGDFFSHKPSEGGWRVCLIDTADDMNVSAANSVLKILEEPPQQALLILLSSQPGRLLPTIRSRCLHMPLRSVSMSQIENWLVDQGKSPDEARLAASFSRGAPGKAFALAQNTDTVLGPLNRIIKAWPNRNMIAEHKLADALALPSALNQRALFWDAFIDIIRAQSVYVATGEKGASFFPVKLSHSLQNWLDILAEFEDLKRQEISLNMDKKTVMMTAFNRIHKKARE